MGRYAQDLPRDRRPAERAGILLLAAAVAVATLAASSLATGLGFGWLSPSVLSTPTDATIVAAPVVAIGLSLAHIGSALGLSVSTSDTLGIAQAVGGLLAVAGGALVAWRTRERGGAVGALALAFLLVVLLSPVLQPWYLTWGLVIAAATRAQRSPWLIALAVAGAFLALPNGVDTISPPLEYVVALAALAGAAWLLTGRRWRRALQLASGR
jgi:alpha-1,6-mannosyltransferase